MVRTQGMDAAFITFVLAAPGPSSGVLRASHAASAAVSMAASTADAASTRSCTPEPGRIANQSVCTKSWQHGSTGYSWLCILHACAMRNYQKNTPQYAQKVECTRLGLICRSDIRL